MSLRTRNISYALKKVLQSAPNDSEHKAGFEPILGDWFTFVSCMWKFNHNLLHMEPLFLAFSSSHPQTWSLWGQIRGGSSVTDLHPLICGSFMEPERGQASTLHLSDQETDTGEEPLSLYPRQVCSKLDQVA